MIKPELLWNFIKTCKDTVKVGRVCQTLGRQEVDGLTEDEKLLVRMIDNDSDWMDERIEDKKRRDRERKRRKAEESRRSAVSADSVISTESTESTESAPIHPSTHPSIQQSSDKSKDLSSKESKEKGTKKTFVPPTVDEVRAYCESRKNGLDAEAFVAFYSSKGWKVGSSPMKDWRSAVITWEKRVKADGKYKPRKGFAVGQVYQDPSYQLPF